MEHPPGHCLKGSSYVIFMPKEGIGQGGQDRSVDLKAYVRSGQRWAYRQVYYAFPRIYVRWEKGNRV